MIRLALQALEDIQPFLGNRLLLSRWIGTFILVLAVVVYATSLRNEVMSAIRDSEQRMTAAISSVMPSELRMTTAISSAVITDSEQRSGCYQCCCYGF